MKTLFTGIALLATTMLFGQSKTEKITRELTFEKKGPNNAVIIANINGNITVEGYSGDVIQVEIEKIIDGKTQARLEAGVKEINLGVIDRADTIVLYVKGVCGSFRKLNNRRSTHGGWNYDWSDCRDNEKDYDYKMNFRVRVPMAANISVSTINSGDISIAKVSGHVQAENINGGIRLTDLATSAKASTINGDVDIQYERNPDTDCRFYTLNGDINAYFKKGLSSNVSFKSFNGSFYTNIEQLTAMPVRVEKESGSRGVRYKVNGNQFKTRNGGAQLDFETFNGNVYLREN